MSGAKPEKLRAYSTSFLASENF